MLWKLRARFGYWMARRLFHWPWAMRQPRLWHWMQGQFARLAALGDPAAQGFYGHILLFRGQGFGAREEGLRLLRLAASAGDPKSAYQLGVVALTDDLKSGSDAVEAVSWWRIAADAGHPLAAKRLAQLLESGAPGLAADPVAAAGYAERARQAGL